MSTGKENVDKRKKKKDCQVLRRIAGKRPLNNCTSAILNRPSLEPAEPPQTETVSAEDEGPAAVETNERNLPVTVTTEEDPPISPAGSKSYLSDLLEADLIHVDTETLADKLNRVLENQKVLFSLVSTLMGDVAQIKKAQGLGESFSVGRGQGGNVTQDRTSDLSLGREQISWTQGFGESFSVGRGQGGNVQQDSTPDLSLGREQISFTQGFGESFSLGRGQGGNVQQDRTPDLSLGREQISCTQGFGESFSLGRGQGGNVQQDRTPDLSLGREQISRTQGFGENFSAGRGQDGNVQQDRTPDLSLGRVQNWEVNQGWSQERKLEPFDSFRNEDQFQSGVDDNMLSQQSDGSGEGGDVFLREAMTIKGGSSIGNFAVNLVKRVFKQEELVNRNCRGSRGKEALNASKLATVKAYCFKLYPTPPGLKEQQWGKCVIAIDEFLRRRKKKNVTAERQD